MMPSRRLLQERDQRAIRAAGGDSVRVRMEQSASVWVGSYVHFALPAALLGDDQVALLDDAVRGDGGWRPVIVERSEPLLTRQWEHAASGEELVLAVLGFFPLLATLGAPVTAGKPTAEAFERVAAALAPAGAAAIGDAQLPWWIDTVRGRWESACTLRRRIDELHVWLVFAQCPNCEQLTHRQAPHCRACGHRATDAEQAAADAQRDQAHAELARVRAELDALARGEGLIGHG